MSLTFELPCKDCVDGTGDKSLCPAVVNAIIHRLCDEPAEGELPLDVMSDPRPLTMIARSILQPSGRPGMIERAQTAHIAATGACTAIPIKY